MLSRLTSYSENLLGIINVDLDTADHIFCIHQIFEKKWEYNEAVHQVFKTSRKLMIQLGGLV